MEDATLQVFNRMAGLLNEMGLAVIPRTDPSSGWGYIWRGQEWRGPYPTPEDAMRAAFDQVIKAMVALSAMPLPQTVGELWRWDSEEDGWFHIGGPGTEDDEEASVLTGVHALYSALDTLRGIETSEIDIPGPAARWQQALRVGYRAYADATARLNSWSDELDIHHERDRGAFDQLADEEEE